VITGNPSIFAIESKISQAFERLSSLGLGSFTIRIKGFRYGVYEPDATLLGCSLDEVQRRLRDRGNHVTPFTDGHAGSIADAFRQSIYGEAYGTSYLGMSTEEFAEITRLSRITWAPDGDEAFDDSSYVLQFDSDEQVRLVAFKLGAEGRYDPSTLADLWIESDQFYEVLRRWSQDVLAEWKSLPKVKD